ncbi:hypothetical protein FQN54_003689 [Arachnomyces sp. PD_36]|nr:hypothetical protein FQN54_003689 [Arachnomyces sp. PD_36]
MEYATLFIRHVRTLKENLKSDGAKGSDSNLLGDKNKFNDGLYSLQLLIGEREKEKPAYWQRAWIIQEIASAKTLILQSGSYIISEEDIELVRESVSSSKGALLMDGRYEQRKLRSHFRLDSFVPVSIYRSLIPSSSEDPKECTARARGPLKLLTLLRHNRSRFCSDMRDKVYSILSISDLATSSHPGLSISYDRPVSEVYIGAVQAIIQSSSMLEVLCSANLAETTAPPHLPSWVPNWSIYKSPDRCDRPISYKHQKATGTMLAKVKFWREKTTHILSATGFCFGSIFGLNDPFVHFDVEKEKENDSLSQLTNYASLYRQLSQAYREMASILYPKPLPRDLFRHTCSLGLLRYDLDDSFQSLMENLELRLDSDQIPERPTQFSGNRFRYKTMAFSINDQCMFAIQPNPLMESTRLADGIIGIAPAGVVRSGDVLCLLLGCSAPLILRPFGNRYLVVCAAYVDTLMDGSAMNYVDDGLFELATFDLE